MYPGKYAREFPEKAAAIHSITGETVTYQQLDENSNRLSQFLYDSGLRRGDHISIFMDNNLKYFEIAWAALRSGLYLTTINRYLTAPEVSYIVQDSMSKCLVTTSVLSEVAENLITESEFADCTLRLMCEGTIAGWDSYEDTLNSASPKPLTDQWLGSTMLYSSGTTGKPKGILRPLPPIRITDFDDDIPILGAYGFGLDTVYLSPAPLYHAAPFAFTNQVHRLGGTNVVMPRFDALEALRCIEEFSITHSQWVPTMFVRMLKLTDAERFRYDLASHKVAIHAAAPCPVDVKRRMIEWWGPIIEEYYAGTEGNGITRIGSQEWLEHPGTVGKSAAGPIHICDEEGNELPTGQSGIVYFEQEQMSFEYHNAPEKTKEAQHPIHPNWSALGDVGYLDEDGYLYLTDRKTFMIISGGVNIYPQEIENALIMHDQILDVAVFGVPNEDFGEEVKAVVQLAEGIKGSADLEQDLIAFAREHLAHYMVPRSIDFIDELPRLPTGKLYKRILRDKYWGKHDSRII